MAGFRKIWDKKSESDPSDLFSKIKGSAQLSADIEEFLPPLLANRGGIEVAQVVQGLGDGVARGRDHGAGIAMRLI